jgi:type III secretion protein L
MAVWLTHGPCTVGFDHGLIRAADFARLADSATIAAAVADERERVLAQARAEAGELLDAARAEAAALVQDARDRLAQAHQCGMSQGLEDAAAHWAGQAMAAAESRRRHLLRQSERLAAIVSMAVERVIEQEDRAGLFRRSLRTIVKLVKDTPMLTLRVTEADRDIAQGAVDAVKAQLSGLPIEVVTDAALNEGGCRFESDGGVIDAGLDTQLAALRRAVARAAQQMARESMAQEDDVADADDAPVDWPGMDNDMPRERATAAPT